MTIFPENKGKVEAEKSDKTSGHERTSITPKGPEKISGRTQSKRPPPQPHDRGLGLDGETEKVLG